MKDVKGRELRVGNVVAYATTTQPGHSKHAVLKVACVAKIAVGTAGEYAVVQRFERDKLRQAIIREPEKLVKLED